MSLHPNEFEINEALVGRLIADQMPDWCDLSLRRLDTTGTVNVIYRLGDDKLVRLPRAPDFSDGPIRESRCLPALAGLAPLSVPTHLALGVASAEYPSQWSVLEWIDGEAADARNLSDMHEAASALGEFVAGLRKLPTDGLPEGGSYRAFGLQRADPEFRRWIALQPEDIDRDPLVSIWNECLAVGEWPGPPSWAHTDLRADNLIAKDGQLVGVIDWEGCAVGDPSADYLSAWWLFDGDSRETFRTASKASRLGWSIAKGWALMMAVAAIPYYTDTNPRFAEQARGALHQILIDDS